MAISGLQVIGIGIQNEPTGSDSLFVAFNKTKTNFATLFACASPYNTYTGNIGISVSANSAAGTIDITNTGVTKLTAGTGVSISSGTGNVVISASGNGAAGVTSVGVSSTTLSVATTTGGYIVSTGNILVNLGVTGVASGVYTYPTVTVDKYGRITTIANAASVGTVTSVGITPGTGIQVSGGPIIDAGSITIVNTGVTRLNPGTGIALSSSNGNITVSSTVVSNPGTVTSVGLTSTTLSVSAGPITTNGSLSVNMGSNVPVTGILTLSGSEELADGDAASLLITSSYMYPIGAETNTLGAGTAGQVKIFALVDIGPYNTGSRLISVTNAAWNGQQVKLNSVAAACTLQYINDMWFCVGNNGADFGPFY